MSKLVKGIGKVFKKAGKLVKKVVKGTGKFLKKYGKYVALAVAVYFTAGAALSYFGTATLPGFASGGIFSNAAAAMGINAGAGVTATTAATSAAGIMAPSPAAFVVPGGVAQAGAGTVLAGTAAAPAATAASGLSPFLTGAAATKSAVAPLASAAVKTAAKAGVKGWWGGLSGMEKFQVGASMLKFAGTAMAESPSDMYRDKVKADNQNAFGIGRNGKGPGAAGGFDAAFGDLTKGSEQQSFVSSGPRDAYGTPQFEKQSNTLMGEGRRFIGSEIAGRA